jgi:hypothetical protein
MNDSIPFKWLLLLLDDVPSGVNAIASELRRLGLEVEIVSKLSRFAEKTAEFQDCNLAVIDMQWANAGKVFTGSTPSVPVLQASSARQFIDDWVKAVNHWSSNDTSLIPRDTHWPRAEIGPNDVGAWIGAMLTWVSPNAEIIFFSGNASTFNKGLAAPLALFKKPRFKVHPKGTPGLGVISAHDLWPYLMPLQKRLLSQAPTRSWLLESVLIPLLADKSPESATVQLFIPSSNSMESRRLEFKYVFPYLVSASRDEKLSAFRELLDTPRLRRDELVALHAVSHVFDGFENETMLSPQEIGGRINRALGFVHHAGVWGVGCAHELEAAKQKLSESVADAVRQVLQAVLAVRAVTRDARPMLRDLGSQYDFAPRMAHAAAVIAAQNDEIVPAGSRGSNGLRILRFPPHWIKEILFTAVHNAKRYSCPFKIDILEVAGDRLQLTFSSKWKGDIDEGVFWKCVLKSIKEGDARGYPFIIRAALESGADALWLKTGTIWVNLWGDYGDPDDGGAGIKSEHPFGFSLVYRQSGDY